MEIYKKMLNKNYIDYLKKQNILVVGVTIRSGCSVSNLLFDLNIKHSLSDSKNKSELENVLNTLKDKQAKFFFGKQDNSILKDISLIILSPGVPVKNKFIESAKKLNIKVISEVEFAYNLMPNNDYIAITGTDGKTTTATLVYNIISSYKDARLVGNVGNTFSKDVEDIKPDESIVIELSSFQLESIDNFKPNISAILNISEDHLDRYDGIEDYFNAKKNIYKKQSKDDYLVINMDNIFTKRLLDEVQNTNIVTFSTLTNKANFYLDDDDYIYYNSKKILSIKDRKLIGVHNRENILSATAICYTYNIPLDCIESVINNFKTLSHRMEYVGTVNGIVYINDSKATALKAVEKAITSFNNVVVIMGGRNKGIDFSTITGSFRKVKYLILTGEAASTLDNMIDIENKTIVEDFDKAFETASKIATNGDTVILSPGCASFDRFKDYEERGDYFKSLVHKLNFQKNKD